MICPNFSSWWLNHPFEKYSSNWIISLWIGVKKTYVWNHHLAHDFPQLLAKSSESKDESLNRRTQWIRSDSIQLQSTGRDVPTETTELPVVGNHFPAYLVFSIVTTLCVYKKYTVYKIIIIIYKNCNQKSQLPLSPMNKFINQCPPLPSHSTPKISTLICHLPSKYSRYMIYPRFLQKTHAKVVCHPLRYGCFQK